MNTHTILKNLDDAILKPNVDWDGKAYIPLSEYSCEDDTKAVVAWVPSAHDFRTNEDGYERATVEISRDDLRAHGGDHEAAHGAAWKALGADALAARCGAQRWEAVSIGYYMTHLVLHFTPKPEPYKMTEEQGRAVVAYNASEWDDSDLAGDE